MMSQTAMLRYTKSGKNYRTIAPSPFITVFLNRGSTEPVVFNVVVSGVRWGERRGPLAT